jgi:hypothetical protein
MSAIQQIQQQIAEAERGLHQQFYESVRVWLEEAEAAAQAGPEAIAALRQRDQARELAWLRAMVSA